MNRSAHSHARQITDTAPVHATTTGPGRFPNPGGRQYWPVEAPLKSPIWAKLHLL
jgi:hypothetical protein